MRALIRWAIASVGSLCLFAAVWALCHYVIGLDNVTSLTWASAFLLVAITALGFWAGRNSAPPSPTAGQTNTANATGDNSQAIAGNSNIVLRAIRDSTVNITASPPAPRTRVSAASDGAAVVGDVPQRPPSFQSRNDLLALLRKHTHEPGTCAVHAVTGMPGAGKTQLVAAYARECITGKWRFVGWINADTDASILNRLSQATAALGIAPGDTQEDTARAVRHHLESNGERCLVVFDNASSPDALRPYLPATGAAHIVITSTLQSVSSLGTPIAVDAFTPAESLAYLHERTGNSDDHGARELAAELGHLPLALAHAAAVIKAQQISYPTYLERLRALPIDCYLMRPHEDPYPRSTAAAILLSLRTAQDTDATALAAPLLGIIALLSSTGVPRRVLHTAPALIPGFHPRSPTQPAQASTGIPRGIALQAGVDAALAHVCDASLLIPSIDGSVFRAHRLTMRIIREHNSHDGTFPAITAAAINVLQVARQATEPIWQHAATARDLTLQITALCHHLPLTCRSASDEVTQALIQLRTWAVYCLNELRDNWPEAIRLGEQLTSDLEQLLGPDHPGTLTSKSNLANAYLGAGQFNQAVTLHEHTLAEREKILAPDHPDILSSRSNLAAAYHAAGRFSDAIRLYERDLDDRKWIFGPNHRATLGSQNNLAVTYHDGGRFSDAMRLNEQTLAAYEQILGPSDPATLNSRNNLANDYLALGQIDKALTLHERTLADRQKVLGPDHPDTLSSRNNLAGAYVGAKRYADAIDLHKRTLASQEQNLGPKHPDALSSLNNLADAYYQAGQLQSAIRLHERTLTDRQKVLDPDHPDILISRNNLAEAYRAARRFEDAITLNQRNLADRERILGPGHPYTLASLSNLARTYYESGRRSDAISLLERTLARWAQFLPPTHPNIQATRTNLAMLKERGG